ncbi:unnamed protein product [Hermetia illucens]|uniref:Uncharacterized protein n=1 Tax=Hermetia illucens TaxID=343691 RepID=A0A7R8YYH6_HERIL|nr:unnamed protein product [Hermetia illucens]
MVKPSGSKDCQVIHCGIHRRCDESRHFGGLWEAQVKSVKRHLEETFRKSLLKIKEMRTALAQVKVFLSSEASDEDALTLPHILIGSSMCSLPEKTPDNV